jgi:catalase
LGDIRNVSSALEQRADGGADGVKVSRGGVAHHLQAAADLLGRVIGCLVSDGADGVLIMALRKAVENEGGKLRIVAPYIGGVKLAGGETLPGDLRIDAGHSVFFDTVTLIVSDTGAAQLTGERRRSTSSPMPSTT